MKIAGKIILSLATLILSAIISFVIFFVATMSGVNAFYRYLILAVLSFFTILLLLKIWNRVGGKKFGITFLILVGLCAITMTGYALYQHQQARILTIAETEVDLTAYEPFTPNSKVATLDVPSTLTISGDIPVIDGATALYPLYSSFVQATYPEKAYPADYSEVRCTKTSGAYKNLIEGSADIIFVAAPSTTQQEAAQAAGKNLKLTKIGYEAFVFFVNSQNPVDNLSTEQIKAIYAGEITNWKDVGGKNKTIRAFQRPENSGSQTRLLQLMAGTPLMEPPTHDVAEGMGGMVSRVADYKNYDNSIGYSFLYYSTEMVRNNQIKLLSIDRISPSNESVESKNYPFITEIYAVTTDSSNPNTQRLINWILSPQGQELVKKTGYIPL